METTSCERTDCDETQDPPQVDLTCAEEEEADETPPPPKKQRVHAQRVDAGFDTSGEPLPTDDSSGLNKKQAHVWKKIFEDLPADAKTALNQADKKEQHRIQNSLIPKTCAYSLTVRMDDAGKEWWTRMVQAKETRSSSTYNCGMTETEMLGKLNNSREALTIGMKKR